MCIKFCANLGKRARENFTVIQQAFKDQIFSRTQVFQWHARFKTGRTSVDVDEHTGIPTSCITLFRQDRRRNIHNLLRRWELVMGHANGL
jgi:hypothetical protein